MTKLDFYIVASLAYFIGLVAIGISIATLTGIPQYGFLIIGIGLILYGSTVGLYAFLSK
jgi:hypothetical protein